MHAPEDTTRLIERMRTEFERVRGLDDEGPARALYVHEQEVAAILAGGAGERPWPLVPERLEALARRFGLDPFEMDVLLTCLAPDLDPAFERVFGFIQDDLTRKRPTVALLLSLFCPDPEEQARRRASFHAAAPLFLSELLRLPDGPDGPLASQAPSADERVIAHLTGDDAVDGRLLAHTRHEPRPRPRLLSRSTMDVVAGAAARIGSDVVALLAPRGGGKSESARLMARELGRSLLVVDVPALIRCQACSPPQAVRLVMREARLLDAVVYWSQAPDLWEESGPVAAAALSTLESRLRTWPGLCLLGGPAAWEPPPTVAGRAVVRLPLPPPGRREREMAWAGALAERGVAPGLAETEVPALAGTFKLTVEQIGEAVLVASRRAALAGRDAPGAEDLRAGARALSGRRLASLSEEIHPRATWTQLVLPDDSRDQLRELCLTVRHRGRVLDEYGFGRRLTRGTGVMALFAGISGTGKTMAAEVIANELGLPLFRIELAGVVSKWIGETEKNLDRVFEAASDSNAILFFDEADALFGKRSEVKDAHDRYANVEISYLLQKMESYDGVGILASNMRQQIDEAFLRRLTFTVVFPPPDHEDRTRIWEALWPPELPRAADVDFAALARVRLTGGNIKNVLLAAAHLAAVADRAVTTADLVHAIRREYQKLGKQVSAAEIGATLAG